MKKKEGKRERAQKEHNIPPTTRYAGRPHILNIIVGGTKERFRCLGACREPKDQPETLYYATLKLIRVEHTSHHVAIADGAFYHGNKFLERATGCM